MKKILFTLICVIGLGFILAAQGPVYTPIIFDTDNSNFITLTWNEDDTSDRTLNVLLNSGDRSLALQGNLTVEANSIINSDLSTDANWATSGTVTSSGTGGLITGSASNLGKVVLYDGSSNTFTITWQAASGNMTYTFPADDGDADQYLQTNGSGTLDWATPPGGGDVVGPASSTDNAIPVFDDTTGNLVRDGLITQDDTGNTIINTTSANPYFRLEGYITEGTAVRYAQISVDDTIDSLLIETENNANIDYMQFKLGEANQRFRFEQNSETMDVYYSGGNWYFEAANDRNFVFIGDTTNPGAIELGEASANGTNKWTVTTVASLTTDYTITLPDGNGDTGDLLYNTDGSATMGWLTPNTGLTISGTDLNVDTASTTASGISELATSAETSAGTDAARTVTPDGLSQSIYGTKTVILKPIAETTSLTTGNGKMYFVIPEELNGMDLVVAHAHVFTASTSGTPTIQIYNLTQTADMLSTEITIDANETDSSTAATAPVIDTGNDDVATADVLRIDVDVAGTGAEGLEIRLSFRIPD